MRPLLSTTAGTHCTMKNNARVWPRQKALLTIEGIGWRQLRPFCPFYGGKAVLYVGNTPKIHFASHHRATTSPTGEGQLTRTFHAGKQNGVSLSGDQYVTGWRCHDHPIRGDIGVRIIAYIDHIGRIEGKIVRKIEGGFAITVGATSRKRDKLASQLTWLANRHILSLPEDRRHERHEPKNPITKLIMEDGSEHICRVMDLSLSGAAIKTKARPKPGQSVNIGKIRARIVRHLDDGLAVEFASLQDSREIDDNLS